jgi:ketosteroid isomerase-like protein
LTQLERSFRGATDWVARQLSDNARLYREGSLPVVGEIAVRQALAEVKGTLTWKLTAIELSKSADLGYAYGTAEFKPADASKPIEKSNFLRIWKKDGGQWKVVLDLLD